MAITNQFYNGTTRKYVTLFGSLFNKMSITRADNAGLNQQQVVVPIAYGPFQKFLAMIFQNPDHKKKSAITLPRMSFEIVSMNYDGTRKLNSLNKVRNDATGTFIYAPAPYNIEFNLNIMTKYEEDGAKIIEQILPFFKPEYTFTAHMFEGLDAFDIPLILNSVSTEDTYESDFITRRTLIWTLSFTMKGWYYGPERTKKIIKFVDTRLHTTMDSNSDAERQITVQPGLTANGEPTTDINETVPYTQISMDDEWALITIIDDYEE